MADGGHYPVKILVAEDDRRLAAVLEASLLEAGWQVETVYDGTTAYDRLLRAADVDIALLDWMLPGIDGVTVARRVRNIGLRMPILMLTARDAVRDRVEGLDSGADDYLRKPFDLDELLARLRALLRRSSQVGEAPITIGDLVVDPATRNASRGDADITLSAREFDILHLLALNAGKVVSRLQILDEVWDGETDLRSNVIDVHLAAIRAKIDKPFGTASIKTLRGVGYRLDVPPNR
ncbi:MAG TPA: response regulator transcription factor [Mycobacteriales bacterium]|nr:response regulator transcription factor [Mycobacteriales bacterium]